MMDCTGAENASHSDRLHRYGADHHVFRSVDDGCGLLAADVSARSLDWEFLSRPTAGSPRGPASFRNSQALLPTTATMARGCTLTARAHLVVLDQDSAYTSLRS